MLSKLIGGLILLGLGYCLVQMSQPYLHSYQFEQMVRKEINEPSHHAEASVIHREILTQGREMGFIIDDDGVSVERLAHGYEVDVRYSVPVDFHFYHAALDFNLAARTAEDITKPGTEQ